MPNAKDSDGGILAIWGSALPGHVPKVADAPKTSDAEMRSKTEASAGSLVFHCEREALQFFLRAKEPDHQLRWLNAGGFCVSMRYDLSVMKGGFLGSGMGDKLLFTNHVKPTEASRRGKRRRSGKKTTPDSDKVLEGVPQALLSSIFCIEEGRNMLWGFLGGSWLDNPEGPDHLDCRHTAADTRPNAQWSVDART